MLPPLSSNTHLIPSDTHMIPSDTHLALGYVATPSFTVVFRIISWCNDVSALRLQLRDLNKICTCGDP